MLAEDGIRKPQDFDARSLRWSEMNDVDLEKRSRLNMTTKVGKLRNECQGGALHLEVHSCTVLIAANSQRGIRSQGLVVSPESEGDDWLLDVGQRMLSTLDTVSTMSSDTTGLWNHDGC